MKINESLKKVYLFHKGTGMEGIEYNSGITIPHSPEKY